MEALVDTLPPDWHTGSPTSTTPPPPPPVSSSTASPSPPAHYPTTALLTLESELDALSSHVQEALSRPSGPCGATLLGLTVNLDNLEERLRRICRHGDHIVLLRVREMVIQTALAAYGAGGRVVGSGVSPLGGGEDAEEGGEGDNGGNANWLVVTALRRGAQVLRTRGRFQSSEHHARAATLDDVSTACALAAERPRVLDMLREDERLGVTWDRLTAFVRTEMEGGHGGDANTATTTVSTTTSRDNNDNDDRHESGKRDVVRGDRRMHVQEKGERKAVLRVARAIAKESRRIQKCYARRPVTIASSHCSHLPPSAPPQSPATAEDDAWAAFD